MSSPNLSASPSHPECTKIQFSASYHRSSGQSGSFLYKFTTQKFGTTLNILTNPNAPNCPNLSNFFEGDPRGNEHTVDPVRELVQGIQSSRFCQHNLSGFDISSCLTYEKLYIDSSAPKKGANLAPAAMIFHMWFPDMMSPPNHLIFTTSSATQTCEMSSPPNRDLQMWNRRSFKRGNFGQLWFLNPWSQSWITQDVWNSGKSKGSTTQLVSRNSAINWAMVQSKELQLYNTNLMLSHFHSRSARKIRKGSGWGVPWRSSSIHCLTSPFRHTKLQGDIQHSLVGVSNN